MLCGHNNHQTDITPGVTVTVPPVRADIGLLAVPPSFVGELTGRVNYSKLDGAGHEAAVLSMIEAVPQS